MTAFGRVDVRGNRFVASVKLDTGSAWKVLGQFAREHDAVLTILNLAVSRGADCVVQAGDYPPNTRSRGQVIDSVYPRAEGLFMDLERRMVTR